MSKFTCTKKKNDNWNEIEKWKKLRNEKLKWGYETEKVKKETHLTDSDLWSISGLIVASITVLQFPPLKNNN